MAVVAGSGGASAGSPGFVGAGGGAQMIDPVCLTVSIGHSIACDGCFRSKCCPEIAACVAQSNCDLCASKAGGTHCDATDPQQDPLVSALDACLAAHVTMPGAECHDTCAPPGPIDAVCANVPSPSPTKGWCGSDTKIFKQCNPVTNAGCHASEDEVCDADTDGVFRCFPSVPSAPSTGAVCSDCSATSPTTCGPASTCITTGVAGKTAQCVPYCCDDTDCGGSKCDKAYLVATGLNPIFSSVGVCVSPAMAAGG